MGSIVLVLLIAAFILFLFILYSAAVLFVAGLVLPNVKLDSFDAAFRAATRFTIWRIVLGVPAAILIALSTVGLNAEAVQNHGWWAIALMICVDFVALAKTEAAVYDLRVDGFLGRALLVGALSIMGVAFQLGS